MRNSIFAVAATMMFTVVGCGGDDTHATTADLAGHTDMASTADLSTATKVGCAGEVQCKNDCLNTATTQAEYDTCSAMCDKNTTAMGQSLFQKALACGQLDCLGNVDAGNGQCALSSDMSMLVDPAGAPMGQCNTCLNDSLAALFGNTCMNASSPHCNPASCTASTTACLNNH